MPSWDAPYLFGLDVFHGIAADSYGGLQELCVRPYQRPHPAVWRICIKRICAPHPLRPLHQCPRNGLDVDADIRHANALYHRSRHHLMTRIQMRLNSHCVFIYLALFYCIMHVRLI